MNWQSTQSEGEQHMGDCVKLDGVHHSGWWPFFLISFMSLTERRLDTFHTSAMRLPRGDLSGI